MDKDKPLTTYDYLTANIKDVIRHPDFSQHALRVTAAIMELTTKQLEELVLPHPLIPRRVNHATHK